MSTTGGRHHSRFSATPSPHNCGYQVNRSRGPTAWTTSSGDGTDSDPLDYLPGRACYLSHCMCSSSLSDGILVQRLRRARPFPRQKNCRVKSCRGASTDDAAAASTQAMCAIGHRALGGLSQANGATRLHSALLRASQASKLVPSGGTSRPSPGGGLLGWAGSS